MKNKELHYMVNIQEDEDGYALYRGKSIVDKNREWKQDKSDGPGHLRMNSVTSIYDRAGKTGNDNNYKAREIK